MKHLFLAVLLGGTLLFGATSKLDDKTGLIWQDNKAVSDIEKTYAEAKQYCQKLTVDGFSDWRLPTIRELYTIIDLSKDRPVIKNGFTQRPDEWFWSSTLFAGDPQKEAWRVSFSYGEAEPSRQDRALHVRCVRNVKK